MQRNCMVVLYKKLALYSYGSILMGISLLIGYAYMRTSYNTFFTIVGDLLLDSKTVVGMENYINAIPCKKFHAGSIRNILNAKFGLIRDLSLEHKASGKTYVSVQSNIPIFIINKSYIISLKGSLALAEYYSSTALASIPALYMVNLADVGESEFLDFLIAFKEARSLLEGYSFVWIDGQEVLIKHKEYEGIIIAHAQALKDRSKIIVAQKLLQKGYKKIDIRFNNQIVCSHLRGVNYEKLWKEFNNSN